MKSRTNRPSLLDLIFSDRNKDYGAYEITKSSVRRIRISFILAVSVFVLLILIIGGVIRIPWFSTTSDNALVYNTVNVKYDARLITELSKPFTVEPKKTDRKTITEPIIVDEVQETEDAEKQKTPLEEQKPSVQDEVKRNDSIEKSEFKKKEESPELIKARTDTVVFVERPPQFPGGPEALKQYIRKNLKYPADAINRKVQGTVVLSFIIEKDGSIKRVIITKNVDPVLDFEAVRIIASMPQWQPASSKGKAIASMIVLPINFAMRP